MGQHPSSLRATWDRSGAHALSWTDAPGLFDATVARLDQASQEGFVVRLASEFGEDELDRRMGKFVRHAHVKSDVHWMNAPMVPNRLADASTG